jgi:hypothetical protein
VVLKSPFKVLVYLWPKKCTEGRKGLKRECGFCLFSQLVP